MRKHAEFDANYDSVANNRKNFLTSRSQSTKAWTDKRFGMNSSNKNTLNNNEEDRQGQMDSRDKMMSERISYVKDLRLKCGQDIYSHNEVKEAFKNLQQRNMRTLGRSREMSKSCTLLKVAETNAKREARKEQFERGMVIKADMMRDLAVKATKMRETKDPVKLGKVMEDFGFPVPDLLRDPAELKKEAEANKV